MRPNGIAAILSRPIFIFCGIGILLLIGIIAALSLGSMGGQKETKVTVSDYEKQKIEDMTKRVFIKDFFTYGGSFPVEQQQSIEKALYVYVSQRDSVPDLYTGVVRQNSFSQTKNEKGDVVTSLLIDTIPVRLTYILQSSRTDSSGLPTITLRCAPKDQQKHTSVKCIDGMGPRE